MSICFIIIFCTLYCTMWLPHIWLSFFRSCCASQASFVGFDVSYKIEHFTILKAPYSTGQPARSGEAYTSRWVFSSTLSPSSTTEYTVTINRALCDPPAFWNEHIKKPYTNRDRQDLTTVAHLMTVKTFRLSSTVRLLNALRPLSTSSPSITTRPSR